MSGDSCNCTGKASNYTVSVVNLAFIRFAFGGLTFERFILEKALLSSFSLW